MTRSITSIIRRAEALGRGLNGNHDPESVLDHQLVARMARLASKRHHHSRQQAAHLLKWKGSDNVRDDTCVNWHAILRGFLRCPAQRGQPDVQMHFTIRDCQYWTIQGSLTLVVQRSKDDIEGLAIPKRILLDPEIPTRHP